MSALLHVYSTHAEAAAALSDGSLAGGDRVERDETLGDRRYRFRVAGAPLALTDSRPLPTLDAGGRLVERLSADAAGVLDADDYGSLADAIDAANAAPAMQGLRLRARSHVLDDSRTLAVGVELLFDPGAVVDVVGHVTELVLQAPVRASRRQIFRYADDGADADPGSESLLPPGRGVVFEGASRLPVPAEWFGVLPANSATDNDRAMRHLLLATHPILTTPDTWLPISFGLGYFEFNEPIDFGPRSVRGEGHLVTSRGKRGSGYNKRFDGTILRFRLLMAGTAVSFGDATVSPSPFRVSGFAIIGPKPADATSTGLELTRCIEASFVDVCVASFGVGMAVGTVQGCSFERFDVWGCGTGLLVTALTEDESEGVANANTVVGFNFNSCDLAIHSPEPPPEPEPPPPQEPTPDEDDPPPPLAKKASQWRFFGGTIQGGNKSTLYDGAVWLEDAAKGFLFCGVWFEVNSKAAGIKLIGGEQHTFLACRFTGGTKEIQVSGGGVGLHVFRDCYAVVDAVTFPKGLPVTVTSTQPVTFDNCGSFNVLAASGLARVVGGYNPKTATDKLDVAPARLGLDQDDGRIPWTAPASAPLQFTSLDEDAAQAQTLMRASKRVGDDQVSLWSLRTSGADRQKVSLHRANSANAAFEFDLAADWPLDPAAPDGSSDPVVIANLRQRQDQLEAIIRGLVKRITTSGTG